MEAMPFVRHKITRRVIKDIKKRSTIGLIFYLILAYTTVYAGNFYERHVVFSKFFLTSISIVCIFRFLQVIVSEKNDKYITGKYYKVFWGSVVVSSLIWGTAFALIITNLNEPERLLISLCCIGLCAGGVVAFIPDLKLSIAFNISMLMPAFLMAMASGGNYQYTIAFMLMLFSVYLGFISIRGNKEYWDAYRNEYLLMLKSRELKRLSNTDVLTNLYNRRFFDEVLEKEWKTGSRRKTNLVILICDLDFFKKVNDRFGHAAGDKYLIKTAEIIRNTFKRETDIVARYGGEEFVMLLPGTKLESAEKRAESIREEIEKTEVIYNGSKINTTISFGIAECIPDHTIKSSQFLEKADKALYSAKESGRNRVVTFKEETPSS